MGSHPFWPKNTVKNIDKCNSLNTSDSSWTEEIFHNVLSNLDDLSCDEADKLQEHTEVSENSQHALTSANTEGMKTQDNESSLKGDGETNDCSERTL